MVNVKISNIYWNRLIKYKKKKLKSIDKLQILCLKYVTLYDRKVYTRRNRETGWFFFFSVTIQTKINTKIENNSSVKIKILLWSCSALFVLYYFTETLTKPLMVLCKTEWLQRYTTKPNLKCVNFNTPRCLWITVSRYKHKKKVSQSDSSSPRNLKQILVVFRSLLV